MYLKELKLKAFRNYDELVLPFAPGVNIFYGENAQGKTNILEAIYLAATSKSHRTNFYREMIQKGQEFAHISLQVQSEYSLEKIDIHIGQNKRSIFVGQAPIRKLEELLGSLYIVMFSPEDLEIVKGGPAVRRRFIDIELSQINPYYYYQLRRYHRLLKQRNTLLKNSQKISPDLSEISVWDEELAKAGSEIIRCRREFIGELALIYQQRHSQISGGREEVLLVYENNVKEDKFLEKLNSRLKKDLQMGSTYYGPHKDDILFSLGDMDLRIYGSQGQCRTAALSLKLSEIDLIRKNKNTAPVLLLDDVLSELDDSRQKKLIENLKDIQVLLTCTGVEDFLRQNLKADALFRIEQGQVFPQESSK